MAYPAYSTEDQLRENAKKLTVSTLSESDAANRIAAADRRVRVDLANVIDFDLVAVGAVDSNFPEFLNLLAQYKAAEMALVFLFGAIRRAKDQGDIDYWREEYEKLLADIIGGVIPLEMADGTSIAGTSTLYYTQDAKPDVAPALGEGEYLEHESDEDLADERPLD